MWQGIVSGLFGLLGIFAPSSELPDTAAFEEQVPRFAQHFAVDSGRVRVLRTDKSSPSPLLMYASTRVCLLQVNENSQSRRVWAHFLNGAQGEQLEAVIVFSAGHELTHCAVAEQGRRARFKPQLEQTLGIRFANNTQFEEALADLVGLAYLKREKPEMLDWMRDRLRTVRMDFSSRNPDHDSSALLSDANIDKAAEFFKPDKLQRAALAENTGG
ncbi:MAG: hypothetical protein ACK4FF_01270 [Limnobacter sp.]|uniref:hypothetical protein n=1 Tax=Limnobacter sp. TaxID=2003368 RepID=UPI00391A4623